MSSKHVKRWSWVLLCVGAIYSFLPFARSVLNFLKEYTSFALAVNVVLGMSLVALIVLIFKRFKLTKLGYGLLTAISCVYVFYFFHIEIAEEKLHLLEYGVLSVLIYYALSLNISGLRLYLSTFVLGGLIGWGDEGVQYLLPDRYFQWSDVWLNVLSCLLGSALAFVFNQKVNKNDS